MYRYLLTLLFFTTFSNIYLNGQIYTTEGFAANQKIYAINTTDCTLDLVADFSDVTTEKFSNLAFHPDGSLYVLTTINNNLYNLYKIDIAAHTLTLVVRFTPTASPGETPLNEIVFDANGVLYAAGTYLYTYDTRTGVTTNYGKFLSNRERPDVSNSAVVADMTFLQGRLVTLIGTGIHEIHVTSRPYILNYIPPFDESRRFRYHGFLSQTQTCDGEEITVTGTVFIPFRPDTTFVFKINTTTFERSTICSFPGVKISGSTTAPNEYLGSQVCEVEVDLDDDDSSIPGWDFRLDGQCVFTFPIADEDAIINSNQLVVDSIVIALDSGVLHPNLEFLRFENSVSVAARNNNTNSITLVNTTMDTLSDAVWLEALKNVFYENRYGNGSAGERRISVLAYSSIDTSEVAFAYLNLLDGEQANAGDDVIIEACEYDTLSLLSFLGNNITLGGIWQPTLNSNDALIVSASVAGTYAYVVRSSDGCTVDTAFVEVVFSPAPVVDLGADRTVCDSLLDASLDVTPQVGWIYIWQDGSTTSSVDIRTSGLYWLKATNDRGCQATDSVLIKYSNFGNPTVNTTPVACFGQSNGAAIVTLTAQQGESPYRFDWSSGEMGTSSLPEFSQGNLLAGQYQLTITDANGCVLAVPLLVETPDTLQVRLEVETDNICTTGAIANAIVTGGNGNYRAQWSDGQTGLRDVTLLSPENYTLTVTDEKGCTATSTLSLTAQPLSTSETITICQTDNYDWQGDVITTDTTICKVFLGTNGCDSTHCITVEILPNSNQLETLTACEGKTIDVAGQSFSRDTVFCQTFIAANGCDSTKCWQLDFLPPVFTSASIALCANELWNGNLITKDTILCQNFTASNGCDSTHCTQIMLKPTTVTQLQATICTGDQYAFNNQSLEFAGLYTDTLISSLGCDSTIVLQLSVLTSDTISTTAQICNGEVYEFQGQQLSQSGVYVENLIGKNGCDSLVQLQLIVLPAQSDTVYAQFCPGSTYTWNGQILAIAGNYQAITQDENGCDVKTTLVLQQTDRLETQLEATICEGDIYNFHSRTLSVSGVFVDTLQATIGCDSIVRLSLMVKLPDTSRIEVTICAEETYLFGGQVLSASGMYGQNLINSLGCDSLSQLSLTVLPTQVDTFRASFCTGSSYELFGSRFSSAGTYLITTTNSLGCAVKNILLLNESDRFEQIEQVTVCEGMEYRYQNKAYTQAGIYTDTLQATTGCDSIVGFELIMLPTPRITLAENEVFCEGQIQTLTVLEKYPNYIWSTGQNTAQISVNTAGTYAITVTDEWNCTADETFELIVVPKPIWRVEIPTLDCASTLDATVIVKVNGGVPPFQYQLGEQEIQAQATFNNVISGEYRVRLLDAAQCTYDTTIFVPVPEKDISIQLQASAENVRIGDSTEIQVVTDAEIPLTLRWQPQDYLNCDTCQTVISRPLSNIRYEVVATTPDGCILRSNVFIRINKENLYYLPNAFSPNGDGNNDYFRIYTATNAIASIESFKVFDRWGEQVYHQDRLIPNDLGWNGQVNGQVAPDGIFIYQAELMLIDETKIIVYGEVVLTN